MVSSSQGDLSKAKWKALPVGLGCKCCLYFHLLPTATPRGKKKTDHTWMFFTAWEFYKTFKVVNWMLDFTASQQGESLLHFCIHEIHPVWKYKQRVSFHSHCLQLLNSTVTWDSRIALKLAAQTSIRSCVHVCGCVCFRSCKNATNYAFGRSSSTLHSQVGGRREGTVVKAF